MWVSVKLKDDELFFLHMQPCTLPCFSIAETDTHAEQDAEKTETHPNDDTRHSMDIQLYGGEREKW